MVVNGTGSADPELARCLIAGQPGVVKAAVWMSKTGALLSRVVVAEDSNLNAKDIQQLCLKRLGKASTPQMVLLDKVKRLAA
ncbi:MAG: hypothetical protein ABUL72_06425 [Armatimonadota bacterium]